MQIDRWIDRQINIDKAIDIDIDIDIYYIFNKI